MIINFMYLMECLQSLTIQPQNSMPDVILWMICGSKRIAYYRIPAYDLLFSRNEDASGKLCGTTEEIRLKVVPIELASVVYLGQLFHSSNNFVQYDMLTLFANSVSREEGT